MNSSRVRKSDYLCKHKDYLKNNPVCSNNTLIKDKKLYN